MFRRVRGWLKWCGLLCGSLSLALILNASLMALSDRPVAAQSPVTIQAGTIAYQEGNFLEAIALWEKILPQVTAEKDKATVYKNLALAYRQTGQLSQAIAQWEAAIAIYRDREDSQREVAQLLTEQAQAYSDLGQYPRAIALLESALEVTDRHPDLRTETAIWGVLGNARSFLAEYDAALVAHQISLVKARELNDTRYLAIALNNLGNLHSKRAERLRYQAELAELEGDRQASALVRREQEAIAAARKLLEESLKLSRNSSDFEEIRALINLNYLICQNESSLAPAEAELMVSNWMRSRRLLASFPNSREKAYGLINLAEHFRAHPQLMPPDTSLQVLEQALATARAVGDVRAQSFALGSLGAVYEQDLNDLETALDYSRQAQFAAQQINAPDSLYRWQWQTGRIFKATGRRQEAIAAYKAALATLQGIRSDLIAANKDLQFDFRQQVEPVYRTLIALLLDDETATTLEGDRPAATLLARGKQNPAPVIFKPVPFEPTIFSPQPPQRREIQRANPQPVRVQPRLPQPSRPQPTRPQPANIQPAEIQPLKFPPRQNLQSHAQNTDFPLDDALDTLEHLKIAEIQNFFGDDCVQVALSQSDYSEKSLQETNTAVVYSIILGDRTHIIFQAPDGTKKHYKVPISKTKMEEEIGTLRFFLETRATEEYLPHAQKLYDWLIRPLEGELAALNPDTLLFINDGVLRGISMAALHDGDRFLVEKYPIATTPGLHLTTLKPLDRSNLEALSLGLTVAKPPFAPLANVQAEMEAVQAILGGVQLLDRDFTRQNLQAKIQQKSFPIVHLATHGKFGFDADNTFLLGYDAKFTIEELDNLLRSRSTQKPVALLVMSACQTAAGDERSALGIGGVAVRAGVEAAIATLWFINDEATVPLIKEFYAQLMNPEITKAEALRRAQMRMIEDVNYSHPAVWSPFILIGNWL